MFAKLYFTNKYNLIETINITNTEYHVGMSDGSRWVCKYDKEHIGNKDDYNISIYDNYGEKYTLKYYNNILTYDTNKIIVDTKNIYLYSKDNTLYPMPDLVIDVLNTIQHPIGVETLRRLCEKINK